MARVHSLRALPIAMALMLTLASALVAGVRSAEPALSIRGIVRALDHAAIATELTMQRVEDVRIKDGAAFAKGDLLLSFDCRRLQAEAAVTEAQVLEAKLAHDSNLQLEKRQAIGRFEVDVSSAKLARARAELAVHASRLTSCRISAPFAGRVAELSVRAHEFPQAGKPLMIIVGTERIEIELLMPSRAFDRLRVGDQFTFAIDELSRAFPARIDRLGAAIDPVSQMVKIYAVFEALPPDVLPGMSGAATGLNRTN